MAHNYTFWGDLIFKPKSREEGMLLMVEGTSRWCWCHPFHHKDAVTIAGIVEKFINLIDERITCLVTDAGTEWSGIPPPTHREVWVCVEEEECDTHRAWFYGTTRQNSEDTEEVHA